MNRQQPCLREYGLLTRVGGNIPARIFFPLLFSLEHLQNFERYVRAELALIENSTS